MKKVLREIIDGSILTRKAVVKNIPFIAFLVLLALVSIANRNYSEKKINDATKLQREVKELRAKSITIASELMEISKQSSVYEEVGKRNLDLNEAKQPPYILEVER